MQLACPACTDGRLELITDGQVGVLMVDGYHRRDRKPAYRMQSRPFLSCGSCEYCIEVNLTTGVVVPS